MLLPIFDRGEPAERVLLTLRSATLPRYSGQVSFPGGRFEEGDADLTATALRETHEEVGIPPDAIEVIDELDWLETGRRDRVKPFVGLVRPAVTIVPNPAEVARVLYAPTEILRRDPFRARGSYTSREGQRGTIWTWSLDGAEVWGLTAHILRAYFVDR